MLNNISVTYASFLASYPQPRPLPAPIQFGPRGTIFAQTLRQKGISNGKRSIYNPMATQASKVSPAHSLSSSYEEYVNPQWVALLNILDMNVRYERCAGSELFTKDGRRILDFLSGYCVHNTGHNHPYIVQALKDELDKSGPTMLQSHVPEIAGELAKRLCQLAGSGLEKVYFGSSGSEGVEAAIKFARATTGRAGIVYANKSFHGLTAGALSLMNDAFWREGFGPLLQDTVGVDYGDTSALESALRSKRHAALVLEPVQAEAGIRVPSKAYLQEAQELCRKTGTLFVIDEVQTGMFRTGTFLASHQFELRPDIELVRGEERSCAKHAGLHFVDHEQRAGLAAKLLRLLQIRFRRNPDPCFGLNRFQHQCRVAFASQGAFERARIAIVHTHRVLEERTEAFAPKGVVHQGKGPGSEAVEAASGVNNSSAASRGAREFDRRLHSFAAAAAKINFL